MDDFYKPIYSAILPKTQNGIRLEDINKKKRT